MNSKWGDALSWRFIGTCHGESFIIGEVDIFKEEWKNTGEQVRVLDPLYGQAFIFNVWKIEKACEIITFVAGEFSNNILGIYTNKNKT
jgi:hypothetical protein